MRSMFEKTAAEAHLRAAMHCKRAHQRAAKAFFSTQRRAGKLLQWINEILSLAELPPVEAANLAGCRRTRWRSAGRGSGPSATSR